MPSSTPVVLPLDVWRDVFELIGDRVRDETLFFSVKIKHQASLAVCVRVCTAWRVGRSLSLSLALRPCRGGP